MANEKEAVEGAEEGAEAPAKGGKKGLIIIIAAVLVLGGWRLRCLEGFSAARRRTARQQGRASTKKCCRRCTSISIRPSS